MTINLSVHDIEQLLQQRYGKGGKVVWYNISKASGKDHWQMDDLERNMRVLTLTYDDMEDNNADDKLD